MSELNIEDRLAICNKCPIYAPSSKRCNSSLWINPDTDEVSTYAKVGYIRGCNCIIPIKARNSFNHCVAGKW
jgi:hypothetical protein